MCQRAGLLIAWDLDTKRGLISRADCDSWNCPECARRMKSRWALRADMGVRLLLEKGEKVDFVTITSHEKLPDFASTEKVWRSAWAKLYAALKRKNPDVQYMIIPERHEDGRMHVHALWSAGVSQKWLKDNARKRGLGYQAKIVHITDAGRATGYVVKYVGKSLGENVPPHFRRVRVSREWADIPEPVTALDGLTWEYVGSNGKLQMVYDRATAGGYDLIDLSTGELFDDIDLGTIVALYA